MVDSLVFFSFFYFPASGWRTGLWLSPLSESNLEKFQITASNLREIQRIEKNEIQSQGIKNCNSSSAIERRAFHKGEVNTIATNPKQWHNFFCSQIKTSQMKIRSHLLKPHKIVSQLTNSNNSNNAWQLIPASSAMPRLNGNHLKLYNW